MAESMEHPNKVDGFFLREAYTNTSAHVLKNRCGNNILFQSIKFFRERMTLKNPNIPNPGFLLVFYDRTFASVGKYISPDEAGLRLNRPDPQNTFSISFFERRFSYKLGDFVSKT